MVRAARIPDWEVLLAHAAQLQTKVPGAVLVGGTAAAVHARHRYSVDHDHVVADLPERFDEVVRALGSIAGWRMHRRRRGQLVLGEAGGIGLGVRRQRRRAALETVEVRIRGGLRVRVPTVAEMLRIKAFLAIDRNVTRDFLDVAALSHHLGVPGAARALERMNELYGEIWRGDGDVLTSLIVALTAPAPYDLTDVDLTEYKGIVAPWNDWRAVERACADLAAAVLGVR